MSYLFDIAQREMCRNENKCKYRKTANKCTIVHAIQEIKTEENIGISTLYVSKVTRSVESVLAGTYEPERALIDQESQTSFMTTRVARQLQLKIRKSTTTVSGLGASNSGRV